MQAQEGKQFLKVAVGLEWGEKTKKRGMKEAALPSVFVLEKFCFDCITLRVNT